MDIRESDAFLIWTELTDNTGAKYLELQAVGLECNYRKNGVAMLHRPSHLMAYTTCEGERWSVGFALTGSEIEISL